MAAGQVIITGASSGLGLAAAKALGETGDWHVVMACRDFSKAARAALAQGIPRENHSIMHLDLAAFDSVRQFVKVSSRLAPRVAPLHSPDGVVVLPVRRQAQPLPLCRQLPVQLRLTVCAHPLPGGLSRNWSACEHVDGARSSCHSSGGKPGVPHRQHRLGHERAATTAAPRSAVQGRPLSAPCEAGRRGRCCWAQLRGRRAAHASGSSLPRGSEGGHARRSC